MPIDDAGDGIRTRHFKVVMADALVIVTPVQSPFRLLKHILDSCLKECIHKAAGIVGVSAGLFGGVRAIKIYCR
jgi:NAD(P)H-dependent FMN reductase